jgi:hypothetical protein
MTRLPDGRFLAASPAWARANEGHVILSRTSKDGIHQHDADLSTFHRISNFRELAIDLLPQW